MKRVDYESECHAFDLVVDNDWSAQIAGTLIFVE